MTETKPKAVKKTKKVEATPEKAATTTSPDQPKPVVKERIGEVVSDKMQKTIVVKVVRRVPHPRFRKIVKVSSKFYAHDEKNEAKTGDKVKIRETRPLSRTKGWELIEVLK